MSQRNQDDFSIGRSKLGSISIGVLTLEDEVLQRSVCTVDSPTSMIGRVSEQVASWRPNRERRSVPS
jgi:hypothetical protein